MIQSVDLFIKDYGNYVYYFEIYDSKNCELYYSKPINNKMNYHVDHQENIFKWVEVKTLTNEIVVYASKLHQENLNMFKLIFAKSIFETNRQESFNDVFKKDEVDYGNKALEIISEEDSEEAS